MTTLIKKFNVDLVIFTGVAGAISEDLNIGDVVISSDLIQHDMDATPFFPKFQLPLMDCIKINADEELFNLAKHFIDLFINN